MTGSLQIKRDKYYAVLSWYEGEKRKQKWIATGLAVKGNKRRAEDVLRQEVEKMRLSQGRNLTGGDQLFLPFMAQWLNEVEAHSIRSTTLEQYKAVFRNVIEPYPLFHSVTLKELTPGHIQGLYNQVVKRGISAATVRKYHTNIHK